MLKYCDFVKKYLLKSDSLTEEYVEGVGYIKKDGTVSNPIDGDKKKVGKTESTTTLKFDKKFYKKKIKGHKYEDKIKNGEFDDKDTYSINKKKQLRFLMIPKTIKIKNE